MEKVVLNSSACRRNVLDEPTKQRLQIRWKPPNGDHIKLDRVVFGVPKCVVSMGRKF